MYERFDYIEGVLVAEGVLLLTQQPPCTSIDQDLIHAHLIMIPWLIKTNISHNCPLTPWTMFGSLKKLGWHPPLAALNA